MKKFIKNYKSTLILLISIILGAIVGLIFGGYVKVISPLGDIFLNLMFIVIVPLVFLTISTSIIKMKNPKRLGKIMVRVIIAFVIMSLISSLIGILSTKMFKLVDSNNVNIMSLLDKDSVIDTNISFLERTANLLTVNDFNKLLSKDSIIPLIIMAMIFGFALRKVGDKGENLKKVLFSLNDVVIHMVNIIMYYAPIGLFSYFATLTGTYGSTIAVGFLKTFIIYTVVCLFIYFVVYSLIVLVSSGKYGLKKYWQNILAPSATALATCSSAASIPVNIKWTKEMGVSSDIAEVVIPLGTSFHKDGSVVGSVFKIMFLVYLFSLHLNIFSIICISLLATILVSAIPIGGGTISEMFIISLVGAPAASLPILTIIATIIDAPATLLNVIGDTTSSMLVARMVDGKNKVRGS